MHPLKQGHDHRPLVASICFTKQKYMDKTDKTALTVGKRRNLAFDSDESGWEELVFGLILQEILGDIVLPQPIGGVLIFMMTLR